MFTPPANTPNQVVNHYTKHTIQNFVRTPDQTYLRIIRGPAGPRKVRQQLLSRKIFVLPFWPLWHYKAALVPANRDLKIFNHYVERRRAVVFILPSEKLDSHRSFTPALQCLRQPGKDVVRIRDDAAQRRLSRCPPPVPPPSNVGHETLTPLAAQRTHSATKTLPAPRRATSSASEAWGEERVGCPEGWGAEIWPWESDLCRMAAGFAPVCRKTEDARRNECDMASSREVVQVQVQFQRSTPVRVRPNPRSNSEGRLRGVQRSERPPSFER
ncbi:hypothetical protein B0H11DRAFT_1901927 [Mycena galericulata]|nr:hypothetical protein B0H11DRAFT_1901927 [Mycena galericulata]